MQQLVHFFAIEIWDKSTLKQKRNCCVYPEPQWQLPLASALICKGFWSNMVWLVPGPSMQFFFQPRNWCRALFLLKNLFMTLRIFNWIEIRRVARSWSRRRVAKKINMTFSMIFKKRLSFLVPFLNKFTENSQFWDNARFEENLM